MQIQIIRCLCLALSVISSLLFANPQSEELQNLYGELEKEIKQTLIKVAQIERSNGNSIKKLKLQIKSDKSYSKGLGLVLQFIPKKGFLVLAKTPLSSGTTEDIDIGDYIRKVDGIEVNSTNKEEIYSSLNSEYGKRALQLSVINNQGSLNNIELPKLQQLEFVLTIGQNVEQTNSLDSKK